MTTPPADPSLPRLFHMLDMLYPQPDNTKRNHDIACIIKTCCNMLVSGKGVMIFKENDLMRAHRINNSSKCEIVMYTDRESLDDIIDGIHEKTDNVVCERANKFGLPFDFMENCIKCRYT